MIENYNTRETDDTNNENDQQNSKPAFTAKHLSFVETGKSQPGRNLI